MGQLKEAFRPEFLNRVDDIIVFHKLNHEDISKIAVRMLGALEKRLENLNITIEFDEKSISAIADKGFDPIYGARPLRRALQTQVEDVIAEQLLGDSVISQ